LYYLTRAAPVLFFSRALFPSAPPLGQQGDTPVVLLGPDPEGEARASGWFFKELGL
jgi:hypothetical protein